MVFHYLFSLICLCLLNAAVHSSKICPELQKQLQSKSQTFDIIVDFVDDNAWHQTHRNLMAEDTDGKQTTRGEKLERVVNSLTKATKESQHSVTNLLNQLEATRMKDFATSNSKSTTKKPHFSSFHNYFIVNSMSVLGADVYIIRKLAEDKSVKMIKLDHEYEEIEAKVVGEPVTLANTTDSFTAVDSSDHFWPMKNTGVRELWAKGHKGKGVVVGSIDSGATGSHWLLLLNHRSTYGWYDPSGASKYTPVDEVGHGSHTVGTMVGSDKYGVAPEAEWIACRNRPSGSKQGPRDSYILKCMEFMTCPWNILGEKDCSKAPHVINNSYGVSRLENGVLSRDPIDAFDEPINLWRKNGIIPVFAAGNSRRKMSCGSVNYPAELQNVITVGATDVDNELTDFSSTGPTINGLTKPDISAPGKNIWSVAHGTFSKVVSFSGTSMAAPHVAGIIALWLSKDPSLTYDQVYEKLTTGARRKLPVLRETCRSTSKFPNNMYGYGIADAKAILEATPAPTPQPTPVPTTKPTPMPTSSPTSTPSLTTGSSSRYSSFALSSIGSLVLLSFHIFLS